MNLPDSSSPSLLDQYDLLAGRRERLLKQFKKLRKEIQDLTPQISIDDIGVMQEDSTVVPRIKPEIVDHAAQLGERAKELLIVQDELTDTKRELIRMREAYYEESGRLLDPV
jgi:hypothetical protein